MGYSPILSYIFPICSNPTVWPGTRRIAFSRLNKPDMLTKTPLLIEGCSSKISFFNGSLQLDPAQIWTKRTKHLQKQLCFILLPCQDDLSIKTESAYIQQCGYHTIDENPPLFLDFFSSEENLILYYSFSLWVLSWPLGKALCLSELVNPNESVDYMVAVNMVSTEIKSTMKK